MNAHRPNELAHPTSRWLTASASLWTAWALLPAVVAAVVEPMRASWANPADVGLHTAASPLTALLPAAGMVLAMSFAAVLCHLAQVRFRPASRVNVTGVGPAGIVALLAGSLYWWPAIWTRCQNALLWGDPLATVDVFRDVALQLLALVTAIGVVDLGVAWWRLLQQQRDIETSTLEQAADRPRRRPVVDPRLTSTEGSHGQ